MKNVRTLGMLLMLAVFVWLMPVMSMKVNAEDEIFLTSRVPLLLPFRWVEVGCTGMVRLNIPRISLSGNPGTDR